MNSRAVAAGIISEWLSEGKFPDRLIEARVTADRAFVTEVVYGAVKWRRTLDWALSRCSAMTDPRAEPFLLVGAYQLLLMSSIEPYAAVNESVEAARAARQPRAVIGFINAILRRIAAEKETILDNLRHQPLDVRESHPDLLVRRWIARYGADDSPLMRVE